MAKEFVRKCGAAFCRGCGKNCAGLPTGNYKSTGSRYHPPDVQVCGWVYYPQDEEHF